MSQIFKSILASNNYICMQQNEQDNCLVYTYWGKDIGVLVAAILTIFTHKVYL